VEEYERNPTKHQVMNTDNCMFCEMGSEEGENSWKTEMGWKWEAGTGTTQWKMPDEGCDVIIQIKFYSVMLLGNIVGPFCTVLLKQLIGQSLYIKIL